MLKQKYGLKVALVLTALGVTGLFGCGGGGGGGSSSTSSSASQSATPAATPPASQPASGLTILINGVAATPGTNGEYSFPSGSRITVSGSSTMSNFTMQTVNASGVQAASTSQVYTVTSQIFDMKLTAPTGYLTTITFTSISKTIKLRYQ